MFNDGWSDENLRALCCYDINSSCYELDLNRFYPVNGSICLNSLDGSRLLFFGIDHFYTSLCLSSTYILLMSCIVFFSMLYFDIICFSLKLYLSLCEIFSIILSRLVDGIYLALYFRDDL